MTTQTNAPAFVPANISADVASVAIASLVRGEAAYVRATEKAEVNRLESTRSAFLNIGVPMTAAQYDKAFGRDLKAKAEKSKTALDVKSLTARAKTIGLYVLLVGDEASAPLAGQTLNEYVKAARAALENAQLASGDYVYPRNEDGSAKKTGPKTGTTKTAPAKPGEAAGSAGSVNDDEGGDNAPAKLRAAQILLGQGEAANRLVIVAAQHADRLAKFLADLLQSEADNAVTRAKDRKAA